MRRILIISYSSLDSDPRILRQVNALKNDYIIESCASAPIKDGTIAFYPIYTKPEFSLFRKVKRLFQFILKKYDKFYWDECKIKIKKQLKNNAYDAVIANDIHSLPLALAIAENKSKVYFDAHEYHPKEFEDSLKWNVFNKPFIEFLCRKYIPKASAFTTVTEAIAKEYNKFLGIMPHVITNAAYYVKIEPSEINENEIKLIHHGAAIKGRQIESMIDMMKLVDKRFSLYLMLTGKGSSYYNKLIRYSSFLTNVHFLDPVPFNMIVHEINKYDVGVYRLPPSNFNNMYALPNKLFEFIQARLAIIISPNPEMANVVKKYNLGKISKDYSADSMATEINELTKPDILAFKRNSNNAANTLTAEENMIKIRAIISGIVNK